MQEWTAAQALQVPPRSPQYLLSKSMKLQLSLEKNRNIWTIRSIFTTFWNSANFCSPDYAYILKWCKSIFSMTWRISISNDYKTWSNCLNNLSFPRKSWDFVVQKYATGGDHGGTWEDWILFEKILILRLTWIHRWITSQAPGDHWATSFDNRKQSLERHALRILMRK